MRSPELQALAVARLFIALVVAVAVQPSVLLLLPCSRRRSACIAATTLAKSRYMAACCPAYATAPSTSAHP
ncbi:hypothetical protein FB451DRAFT_1422834 [Mycena latifolia]|nr:hypothetical protein FB451DRAFT_1422834 [Mycena latifolia]